jgi:hypothetical protein
VAEWAAWSEQAKNSAATWLFLPRQAIAICQQNGAWYVQLHQTCLYIQPLSNRTYWLEPPAEVLHALPDKHGLKILNDYKVLVSEGQHSGFVVEAAELADFSSLEAFANAVKSRTRLDARQWTTRGRLQYRSLQGDLLDMQYDPADLRCKGAINGKKINYSRWANGAVYQSPYVQIKDGLMRFSDGKNSYQINCRGARPVFKSSE